MPNADSQKTQILATDEETSELETTVRASSPSFLIDNSTTTVAATNLEGQPESAPEISGAKNKTRSRFSAAIKKFSRSRRKKEKLSQSATASPEPSDSVLSSGAEESNDLVRQAGTEQENLPPKKHKKLSKRFLLGSLKRSKISPKNKNAPAKEDDAESVGVARSFNLQTQSVDALNYQPEQQSPPTLTRASRPSLVSDLVTGGSLQRLDRIRKVQITISGRKIESTQSVDAANESTESNALTAATSTEADLTGKPEKKQPPEGDYLTPTEDGRLSSAAHKRAFLCRGPVREPSPSPASSSSTIGAVTDLSNKASKKRKIKSKKISNTAATNANTTRCKATEANSHIGGTAISTTTADTSTGISGGCSTSTTTITSPSATDSTVHSQPTPLEQKYVITQTKCDTPPRELAPAKPSRSIVAIAAISQAAASTGAIPKASIRPQAPASYDELQKIPTKSLQGSDASQAFTETESDLMQSPQDVLERGHRFPKPTNTNAATSAPIPIEPTPAAKTIAIGGSNEILESAATASSTATTNPQQRQRQIKFNLQSLTSSTLSQSASPPARSEIEHSTSPQPSAYASPTPSSSSLIPSRAATSAPLQIRSFFPSERSYLEPRISSGDISSVGFTHSSDLDDPISSAESAQHQESQDFGHSRANVRRNPRTARNALAQEDSIKSNKSSDSQSPVSESSRKRIPFVAQPSLYDDHENDHVESRREALSYLFSAVSDYSVESEIDQDDNQMPAFGDLTMDQGEPPIMTSTAEKREHLYKILVIGELGTGKTSFIKRYVHQFFSQNYRATIGVDFALKVITWDANTIVRLQLWDIAGQERFGNMTRVYYKEAVGAFIVFDVTRSGTFDCVSKWKEDLDSKVQLPDGSPIPCILLANKCDQDKQGIVATPEKLDEYVRENGFAGWFETSAKENINIDEAAKALVNKILLNDKLISEADLGDSDKFNLNTPDPTVTTTDSKAKCSC